LATVSVEASARIHLGFLDLHGGLGRRFGSLGLSLAEPVTRVTLAPAQKMEVAGPEAARARRYLARLEEALGGRGPSRLAVEMAIPAHAGLGSGTQLALSIAAAYRRLHDLPPDTLADATLLDRGRRSGIGIGLFEAGGVALDGGRGKRDAPAPVLARLPFPESWRVLLLLDPSFSGVHGAEEVRAFAALPPMPEEAAGALCRLAVMQALPALVERDCAAFGAAVTRMQEIVGDHFAPAQGGRFASPAVAACLEALARAGAAGVGQSSWGPTGFAFAADEEEARRLAAAIDARARERNLEIRVTRGLNRGAKIEGGAPGREDR